MDKDQLKEEILRHLDFEKARIEPFYQDVKNEITQPDNITTATKYFWTKWAPLLGPVATCLILRLRQYCYYNRITGEKRDYCWPSQTTLAEEIGIKDKRTIQKAIALLEITGFVRREPNYRYDQVMKKKVRSTDTYYITMDDPLVEEDKIDLVIRTAERIMQEKAKSLEKEDISPKVEVSPQVVDRVDKPGPKVEFSPYKAGDNFPRKEYLEEVLNNVNVIRNDENETSKEREIGQADEQEALAQHILEELGDVKSLGFYRKVARTVPEHVIYRALSETKDAALTGRIKRSRGACFTDLVKRHTAKPGLGR